MLEIVAVMIGCCCMIHVLVLWIGRMRRDNSYNQNISVHGGKTVGDSKGREEGLLYGINDQTDTMVIRGDSVSQVTSPISGVYVRLYQLEQGQYFDYYLEKQLLIGRMAQGEGELLTLADPMVSFKHCRIYRQGRQILLQDLDSTNHTYLNGCLVEGAMPLISGDKIRIGRSTFLFQCFI